LTFRAGRAVGFRLGGNLASVLLGIGLGVILARILPPREFGIFGVGWGIVAMAEIVGSCGMLQALVQRKTLGAEDEATAGILQLSGALLLGGGLVVAGPTLERLFGMPGLGPLIQVQSVVLVVNGLGLVPTSRLTRRLAFGRLTAIDTGTRVLGGVVSILSALHGVGAIALAIGSVTTGVSRSCLTWIFAPGRTPLKFSLDSAKNLLGYGTGILLIRIFNDFAHRVDVLILGQRLGAEVVGLYQRAFQLVRNPLYQLTSAANTVLLPAMASVQDEDWRFRRGYLGAVALSGILAFPVLTLLGAMADPLIPLLYGPMWTGTVPILTGLAFVGYLRVVNNPNGLVTQARGQVMQEAACQATFMGLTALFAFAGTAFGIQGVVVGIGMASFIFLVMMTRLALSIAGLQLRQWLRALRTAVVSSTVMGSVVWVCKSILSAHMSGVSLLITVSFLGLAVYALSVRLLLTTEERQTLERLSTNLPRRIRNLVRLCMGSVPACPPESAGRIHLLTDK